eukprot:1155396-Amorphochlora_amoeboformis.AAC.2
MEWMDETGSGRIRGFMARVIRFTKGLGAWVRCIDYIDKGPSTNFRSPGPILTRRNHQADITGYP